MLKHVRLKKLLVNNASDVFKIQSKKPIIAKICFTSVCYTLIWFYISFDINYSLILHNKKSKKKIFK